MMKTYFLLLIFIFSFLLSSSQDTLRILQYNLLYYGTFPSFCPKTSNDPDKKDQYLKTIINHIKPDVFAVNELGAGNANASRILDSVLNTGGENRFRRGLSTNTPGSSIVNMLYYNSEKLVLYSQEQVSKDLNNNDITRVIDLYTLFYNDPELENTLDTIFITFIVAHLKAGSSGSDQERRSNETAAIMNLLHKKGVEANYVFSGDFNVRSSDEMAYQNLINHFNPLIRFYDPVSQSGTWHKNPDFAAIHTQSTRVTGQTNFGCFAGGGSDDRFDFILASKPIMENSKGVQYISDSYKVPGQDGERYLGSLIDPPNYSEPEVVISALYEMSDHYPVQMDLLVGSAISGSSATITNPFSELTFTNPVADVLNLNFSCHECLNPRVEIINLSGMVLSSGIPAGQYGEFKYTTFIQHLPPGIYFLKVSTSNGLSIYRKIFKK